MADKNIQIKQRNAENNGWDNLFPKTKGSLVEVTGGTVEEHVSNNTAHVSSTDRSSWNTAKTHADSAHAPANAQKNSDITKAEIEAKLTGTVNSHTHASGTPTAHKDTHLPGGSDAIPLVTTSADGLMAAADKTKLNGIAAGANNYTHPTGDGNLHVPATGTSNNGKVLKAGATAGSVGWGDLTASDVGAAPSTHTHDASNINAGTLNIARIPTGTTSSTVSLGNHTHSNYVPTTRTINTKALSSNIELTASDVGAQKEITLSATAPTSPVAGEIFFEILS